MNETLSIKEFFEKYWVIKNSDGTITHPKITQSQLEFLELCEKAKKDGKQLCLNHGRPNKGTYIFELAQTIQELENGKTVALVSFENPNKYLNDLKNYFGNNIKIKKDKKNKDITILKLK
jgi:hypothetical protein